MQLSRQSRLLLAFFLIYFIWGSTYLAIRYAVATIPPFLLGGSRFLVAGLLMYGFVRWRGTPAPALRQWLQLGLIGVFLFLGGNGFVVWAEQYVESGLAALLVALLPLWLILLDWLWAHGPRPSLLAATGIGLGVAGTVLLIDPDSIGAGAVPPLAMILLLLAAPLWAVGSIYSKKIRQPASIFMAAACQMIGGGLALLLLSFALGEPFAFDPGGVSLVSFASYVYLMVFGSMVAISAYVWLLQNAPAASVSTYAFVNPAVAMLLGWLVADETIDARILTGAGVILAGVFLVVQASRRPGA